MAIPVREKHLPVEGLNPNPFGSSSTAFFEPNSDFSTNPTLVALAKKFLELGTEVDLFCPQANYYPQLNLHLKRYGFPYSLRLWCYGPKRTWFNYCNYFLNRAWISNAALKRKRYSLIFGIDSQGVIAAYTYAKKMGVPFVYLSFEIFFREELKLKSEIREKQDEIVASRNADLIIIQDEKRAELLKEENSIPGEKFVTLPVAPKRSRITKGNYLRKRFNIPEEKIIVLHAGSFENWTCADELIGSLPLWPHNTCLVIHTRKGTKHANPYIGKLKELNSSKVVLSTVPLEIDEFEEMTASADIGLTLYKPIANDKYLQKNIKVIGLASGKFSQYLKCGLPVISLDQHTYAELLNDYTFGVDIKHFSEIGRAIKTIYRDYEHYHLEALRLFSEKLSFDANWNPLKERLAELLKRGQIT